MNCVVKRGKNFVIGNWIFDISKISLHFLNGMDDLFFWGFIGILVATSLFKLRAWPLFEYSMFSRYLTPDEIIVFCLYLEKKNGEVVRWKPLFFSLQREFSEQFKRLWVGDEEKQKQLGSPERDLLKKCLQQMKEDRVDLENYVALQIFQKSVVSSSDGDLEVQEKSVLNVSLCELGRNK